MLVIDTPTSLRIPESDLLPLVKAHLTYTNKSIQYQIAKLKRAAWFDREKHAERLAELQEKKTQCLLYEDENGHWTLSGLAEDVARILHLPIQKNVTYPEPKLIPWAKIPPDLRDYQEECVSLFLQEKHASVEMATGLGKSFILMHLVKRLGLKAVVMAPTESIAKQLYADFSTFIGKARVGRYFGGKKDSGKLITIAIHASLVRIEPGSDDWAAFSDAKVFVADESHLTPAATLFKVCTGLLARAPYRFFVSGTQMRGDGADILLRGITGPVLKKMTVVDGVNAGWLAKPTFRVIQMMSHDGYQSSDPMKMTQRHLLYNPDVIAKACAIANAAVQRLGHQVLILIDEVEQFAYLLPHLRAEVRFAHGPLDKNNLKVVPKQYQKVDNSKLVEAFNNREYPILVGTSAIGMGTDVKSGL